MKLENVFPHKRNTNVTVNGNIYRVGDGGFIVDADGNPFDVPDEDAEKLLQGRAWRALSWDPKDPANKFRFASVSQAPGGPRGRPPRSMQQLKADYGDKADLAKGKVAERVQPQAALDGIEDARKRLGIAADQGGPSDAELERLRKADEEQAKESLKRASKGEKSAEGLAEAETQKAYVDLGGDAAVGDGRAPAQTETAEPEYIAGLKVPDTEAGEEWPDPTPDMPKEYLQAMADAYEVVYTSRWGTKKLAKAVNEAMYPEILE